MDQMKVFIPLTMTYINTFYRSVVHKQKLKSHNKRPYQLTIAEGQDVKIAVTKEVAGYITVAVPHFKRNNSCQTCSSHHKHELIVTDNNAKTIASYAECCIYI